MPYCCPSNCLPQAASRVQHCLVGVCALAVAAQKVLAVIAASGDCGSAVEAGAGGSSGPAGSQETLSQQLRAAQKELKQAQGAMVPGEARSWDHLAGLVQRQLEPAARLAALVEAFYQQPEQRAAAALELAQAAATRRCANLRCPNIGGEGREAEGRPNQRCSVCRAVRYCCRECSVVDWRAGHKRVCGALAAAAGAAAQQS